jgi:hypothetical protein
MKSRQKLVFAFFSKIGNQIVNKINQKLDRIDPLENDKIATKNRARAIGAYLMGGTVLAHAKNSRVILQHTHC